MPLATTEAAAFCYVEMVPAGSPPFRARRVASRFMANSVARLLRIGTVMDVLIWRCPRMDLKRSYLRTRAQSPVCVCGWLDRRGILTLSERFCGWGCQG